MILVVMPTKVYKICLFLFFASNYSRGIYGIGKLIMKVFINISFAFNMILLVIS